MAVLGPTFGSELIAAGLGGLPIVWTADGVTSPRDALTPAQSATLDSVILAHDPTKTLVPDEVAPLQARRALRSMGVYAQAQSAVNGQSDPDLIDAWNFASHWQRSSPWIGKFATLMSWTRAQTDDFFRLAVTMPNGV